MRDPSSGALPGEAALAGGFSPSSGAATTSAPAPGPSPGLSPAVARVPSAPTLPDWDPSTLGLAMMRMANELFTAPPSAAPHAEAPSAEAAPSGLSEGAALVRDPDSRGLAMAPPAAHGAAPPAPQGTAAPAGLAGLGSSVPTAAPPSPFFAPLDFDRALTWPGPSLRDGAPQAWGGWDTSRAFSLPLVEASEGEAPPAPSAPDGPYWLPAPSAATAAAPPTPLTPPTPEGAPDATAREAAPPAIEAPRAAAPALARPSSPSIFDANAIAREFPILRERVHGHRLVWLDNAATTQKPQAVIDRLAHFYSHENSNIHRAAHTLAARATEAYEQARATARRFLGASSTEEIIFVRGATEGINLVAQSWGRRNVGPGDEIVVTWLEHHANIVPWQQLAAERGARLRVAPVDDSGQILLDEYDRLLTPRTRLVAMTQVSNALGTITPARHMIELAHRRGIPVLLDGAQAVSHLRVDVTELDCDFYVLSGHKVFGPTGIGVLYGKRALLEAMPPWQGGGNMIADVTFERTHYQGPPARFEAGTGNIADAVGLGAALEWLERIGLPAVTAYEHELLEYATEHLRTVPGLTIIGTAAEKAGVISFVLAGVETQAVGGMLDREGIAVRSGHHCAQPILRRFGVEATVRASLAPYNTRDDIDALVAALRRLMARS